MSDRILHEGISDRIGPVYGLFDIFIVTETSPDAVPLQPVFYLISYVPWARLPYLRYNNICTVRKWISVALL